MSRKTKSQIVGTKITIHPLTKKVKSAELNEDFDYGEAEKSAEMNTNSSENSKSAKNFETKKDFKLHKEIEIHDQSNIKSYSRNFISSETDLKDKADLKMTIPPENLENSNNCENFVIEENEKSGIDNSKEVQKHQHTSACYSSKWANKDSSPCPIFVKDKSSLTLSKDSPNEPMEKAKEELLTQTDQETKIVTSQNGINDTQNLQRDDVQKKISTKEGTE